MKEFIVKHGEAFLVGTLAIFAPVKGMIITALLAVCVDFITGILAAKKLKVEIKSYKMGTSVSRAIIYGTAILMFYLIQTFLLNNEFPLVNWIAGVIGTKEAFSILENLNKLSGGALFTEILNKLSSINYKKEDPKDPPV